MGSEKRKASSHHDAFLVKRKKKKIRATKTDSMEVKSDYETNSTDTEEFLKAELLDTQTIREGMLLLGCVADVRPTFFLMSLPGCLTGIVPINNISDTFTKALASVPDHLEEFSLESIVYLGAVYPCKVIQVLQDKAKKKPHITLSINPDEVNIRLKPSSIYLKMVLYVAVHSIEDHGYIVDVGSKNIQGFLPRQNSVNKTEMLKVGEVIPTCIKKITVNDKKSANIQLAQLNFNEDYPEISEHSLKLHSVLPGARISADVIEIKQHFVYMKYLEFDACASLLSCGSMSKRIKVGAAVRGTVLYIHPITNMIYLTLNSMPSPSTFSKYFGLRKFDFIMNPKLEYFYKNRAYYKVKKGTYGFINVRDLPNEKNSISSSSDDQKGVIPKTCVISFHYIDNLVQMTAKSSLTEKKITLPENVQIGDIYETTVVKHVEEGMHVSVCPGLSGFIRRIHMSDVFMTKPEKLFPLRSKVKCRVLFSDGHGKVIFTCKESLVNLPDCYVLSSYENARRGKIYTGVIVKVTDSYILVLFFNNIQGFVPSSHIPESSVFFVGQTVVCQVLNCISSLGKLQVSLKTEGWCAPKEIDNALEERHLYVFKPTNSFSLNVPENDSGNLADEEVTEVFSTLTSNGNYTADSDAQKPIQAVIKKVKNHQLHILLNDVKGRVHITNVGCMSEGVYPLKEFTSNQKIEVYVTGEYIKKRRNYLIVTHKNIISFKECSLNLPAVPMTEIYKPGCCLIGFVKEVYDVYAKIWLSPTVISVLDYLHFSENVKFVRKLHKHLKVGLSVKVSILDDEHSPTRGKNEHSIAVTKRDCKDPQVGENILGLVQVACLERGLIVKLPFGYHGAVSITDLSDIYVSAQTLLERYRKLKFIQCHVLEVDYQTKYCLLSLRKSRLFKLKTTVGDSFCPEITPEDIKRGKHVKGYIKSVSDSAITVLIGRQLEGKIEIHHCSLTDCAACSIAKCTKTKYSPGNVVEVVVDSMSLDKRSYNLLLSDNQNKKYKYDRLSLKEDISWDEML